MPKSLTICLASRMAACELIKVTGDIVDVLRSTHHRLLCD
jgi:hypothetical protein